ncbi:hypothetical protein ABT218_12525 [Streptomyces sp. NPDC001455]|uniref:hypothetical protein n=1 Tax=Streptomyces sp. NPDC001455 TaxID=3154518 RepID=UPI00331E0A1B
MKPPPIERLWRDEEVRRFLGGAASEDKIAVRRRQLPGRRKRSRWRISPEQLIDATRREIAGLRPFTVQMGPTWPGVTAVTVAMYPETGVAGLNKRVRAAAEAVPGIELRPAAKFWAHSTLAYVRDGDFDDRTLNRGLPFTPP